MDPLTDVPAPRKKKRLGTKHWYVIAGVLVIALTIGLVAVFGGFKPRTDRQIVMEPGADIDAHAAVIRIHSATAEHRVSKTWGESWTITIMGEILNVSDRQIEPSSLHNIVQFQYTNGEGKNVVPPSASMIVCKDPVECGYSARRVIPPMATFYTVRWQFIVYDGFTPHEAEGEPESQGLLVGVWPMEYRNNTVLDLSQEEEWAQEVGSDSYWGVRPPVEVIDQ